MIGRFLEISLHAPDILESIEFWEKLGFRQVTTNDVWSHPYAVVSDGHAVLGLHAYRFNHSPALTFVRQDLASHLPAFAALDIEFEFAKTGEDQFHEAGFLTSDGQMVTLLESRTCSPPAFEDDGFSVCGEFEALLLPVRHMDEALPFWARLGLAVVEYDEAMPDTALLTSGALPLRLSEDRGLRAPSLSFRCDDIDDAMRTIAARIEEPAWTLDGMLSLTSPEGLPIRISKP